ncbi:MAG: PhoX family phosphatase [Candidatus Competibacteraceae bacterium]|nr:PhoX family phosphatase [Candidatus Competibacteraceae bacterium]
MTDYKPDSESFSKAFERADDNPSNPTQNPTIGDVINTRFKRRQVLKGALGVSAIAGLMAASPVAMRALSRSAEAAESTASGRFDFSEVTAGVDETHHVADGYDADILIRWGDPVLPGAPAFDPTNQSADAQEQQFGYNNDFIGFVPLDGNPEHGLLWVNHEYTNAELMFPGHGGYDKEFSNATQDLADIEMAAHGGSIIEIKKENGKWQVVKDSKYARRITTRSTEMLLSGPAAGHERMKTIADASGSTVIGMLNNCAGGVTPWGTILSGEENFHGYFGGELSEDHPEYANYKRYGAPGGWYAWSKFHDRFDINKEPREANRFGWIVEIDPMDPTSKPVKRTALGRLKHEGASPILNKDGRVAVYMGDDQRFDYVYKFISSNAYDAADPAANKNLLDDGVLYVARFNDDGSVNWLPLVHGQGPLTADNGFNSQADVLIETRRAADLLGATPMDRPEDVEPNPQTGKIYVMLTNNSKRKADKVDAANPRGPNPNGHIIEISPPENDHSAATASWDILALCGSPDKDGATFSEATTENGWFADPDNCAFDSKGRLWIATDGNNDKDTGRSDGVWAMETDGELRGTGKHFFRCPVGAELCGPWFSPDDTALFVAVQHPADGGEDWAAFGRKSTYDDPATRWPDFDPAMPPRPSVMVISKKDGGSIG